MTSVRFHPEARVDFDEAVDWYLRVGIPVALRFVNEVERATELIVEAPRRWPQGEHGTRRLPLVKFPFVVVYRERGRGVEIVAVAHDRREPAYWSGR